MTRIIGLEVTDPVHVLGAEEAMSRNPDKLPMVNRASSRAAMISARPMQMYDEDIVTLMRKAVRPKTTKTVVTRLQSIGKNPFEGRSQSTRTEESSLLPEDEARRLPLDEIVMVNDAQMPVRAKRIQYFDDRLFKAIHDAQSGELPFPKPGGGGSQGNLPLSMRAMPMLPPSVGSGGYEAARQAASGQSSGQTDVAPKKTAPVVQAVIAEEQSWPDKSEQLS